MGFNCGIVGLPNVGKSTLFNALTATAAAEAANYPFCTIEPNVGRVGVPDRRLDALAKLAGSAQILPTQLEFVDIAGLVKGASRGEGLGNKFLANIREVDAIVHVLRCFEDGDITHVEGTIDPLRDAEIINTELMLADLESLEKRQVSLAKKARGSNDAELLTQVKLIDQALVLLAAGKPARFLDVAPDDQAIFRQLQLLSGKPVLYVCNVNEADAAQGNAYTQQVMDFAAKERSQVALISAAIEAEVSQLESEDEKREFLASMGLEEPGLAQIIAKGYALLQLITFFTIGPKEARAWTVHQNAKAPEAAGVIHTDFARGFICAETVSCEDYIACGSEQAAKTAGKLRLEGRDYLVRDGDVFHFRFNV
jgi:GTP-binding protein YchF